MSAGHIADANSIALWKWTGNAPFASYANPQSWNTLSEYSATTTLAMGGVIANARANPGVFNQKLYGAGAPSISSTLQGEWTIEAWICLLVDGGVASNLGAIFQFIGLGASESDGCQAGLYVLGSGLANAGKLSCQWRRTASWTLVETVSTVTVPVGVWTHVAAAKKSVGGGLYSCTLYINGAQVGFATGLGNATGGSSSNMRAGVLGNPNFSDFVPSMAVDEIHVSNIARDSAYILADAQRVPVTVIPTYSAAGHVTDANSIALWKWTGAAPFASYVNPQPWNTVYEGSTVTLPAPGVILNARAYLGNTVQKLQGTIGQAAMSAVFQGEWTVEAWVYLTADQLAGDVGLIFQFCGFGLAQADNIQCCVGIWGGTPGTGNNGKVLCQWRYNSAVTVQTTSTVAPSQGAWHHIAAVKKSVGGGLYSCTIYLDGGQIGFATGLTNSNGGSSSNMRCAIGGDANFADAPFTGLIDEIHISNVARDAAFILTNSQRIPKNAGAQPVNLTSVTGSSNTVTLAFDQAPLLLQDALLPNRWIIKDPNGAYVPVFAVNTSGNNIVLTTGWQADGTIYTLNIPQSWIASDQGSVYSGSFIKTFTGVATSPTILIVKTIDARTLEVWFSKPVNKLDALNTNNYSINNGLTVISASQVSDSIFRLTTSIQTVGTNYTVTASNIRDFQGIYV